MLQLDLNASVGCCPIDQIPCSTFGCAVVAPVLQILSHQLSCLGVVFLLGLGVLVGRFCIPFMSIFAFLLLL